MHRESYHLWHCENSVFVLDRGLTFWNLRPCHILYPASLWPSEGSKGKYISWEDRGKIQQLQNAVVRFTFNLLLLAITCLRLVKMLTSKHAYQGKRLQDIMREDILPCPQGSISTRAAEPQWETLILKRGCQQTDRSGLVWEALLSCCKTWGRTKRLILCWPGIVQTNFLMIQKL